jgi:hypothetical protein
VITTGFWVCLIILRDNQENSKRPLRDSLMARVELPMMM